MWRHFEYSRLSSQNLNSVSLSLFTSSFFSALWRCFHDENSGCLVSVAVLPLSLLSTSGLGVGEITMGLVGPIRTGVRLRLLPVATGVLADVAPFGNTFRKLKVCNDTRRRGLQIIYKYFKIHTMIIPQSRPPSPPRQTATAVDGTHPTGMHSGFWRFQVIILQWHKTARLSDHLQLLNSTHDDV